MGDAAPIDVEAILQVSDESASSRMYHQVLDTIGHDHSGTLYAEAEGAVEPLIQIAVDDPGWPANTAIDVLIDILGSFVALAVATPDHPAAPSGMRGRMRAAAARHLGALARVAASADDYGTNLRAAQLVEELTPNDD